MISEVVLVISRDTLLICPLPSSHRTKGPGSEYNPYNSNKISKVWIFAKAGVSTIGGKVIIKLLNSRKKLVVIF